jgi:hypothetical protein
LSAPRCDVAEAVAFALRHAEPKAEARKVLLTSAVDSGIAATCDRQVGRRMIGHLIETALNGSGAGGVVHVFARRLKGVVLLRVATDVGRDARDMDERLDVAALRTLVEGVGGTLVVDRESEGLVLSVRLDLAAPAVAKAPMKASAGGS